MSSKGHFLVLHIRESPFPFKKKKKSSFLIIQALLLCFIAGRFKRGKGVTYDDEKNDSA